MPKKYLILVVLLLVTFSASSHVVVEELENMSGVDAGIVYLKLGYRHILPLGLDHILFVLSLFLLSPKLKPIIWQSTAFTIAHTVTLGLAMCNIIHPPARVVEPLISLSILFVALQNIYSPVLKPSRVGLVFLFGLVHGLGFASALSQLGLPKQSFLTSLIMFNVGVELGQLTVILLAFFLAGYWFGKKPYYRNRIVIPASLMIVMVAAFWTVQRIFY